MTAQIAYHYGYRLDYIDSLDMHDIDMLLYFITPDEDKKKNSKVNTNQADLERAQTAFKAAKEREKKRLMSQKCRS